MKIFTTLVLLIALPQIWAATAGRSAALRVGLLTMGFGLSAFFLLGGPGMLIKSIATRHGTYADTYYIVSNLTFVAKYLLALGVLSAILWWADPPHRRLPRHCGTLASLLAVLIFELLLRTSLITYVAPRRYVDDGDWIRWVRLAEDASAAAIAVLYLTLLGFGLVGLWRRWRYL